MDDLTPIDEAIKLVGLKPLAAAIDVSYQMVQKYSKSQVTSEKVLGVAEATDWRVTPHMLRPDLYPHPHDGLPVHLRVIASSSKQTPPPVNSAQAVLL